MMITKPFRKALIVLFILTPLLSIGQDFNAFLSDCLKGDEDAFDAVIEKYGTKNSIYEMLLNVDEFDNLSGKNGKYYSAKFLLSTQEDWQAVFDKFETSIDEHPAIKGKNWTVNDDFYQGMTRTLSLEEGKKHFLIELYADYSQQEKRVTLTINLGCEECSDEPVKKAKASEPATPGMKCIEGNCYDSYSKMEFIIKQKKYYYEGNMLAGHPHGMGKLYAIDDSGTRNFLYHVNYNLSYKEGVGMSQSFDKNSVKAYKEFSEKSFTHEEGRMGHDFDGLVNSRNLGTIAYFVHVFEKNELVRTYPRTMSYHKVSPNTSYQFDYPLNAVNGTCKSGDCQNGQGVISFVNLGDLEAYFSKGMSEGMGILTLLSGEKKLLKLYNGVPDFRKTLALPKGASEISLLTKKEAFAFYSDDCVKGNCYDGYGSRLILINESFIDSKTGKKWWGIQEGNFEKGVIQGKATIKPVKTSDSNLKNVTITLNYIDGLKNGEALFTTSNGKTRKLWFDKGIRVLANGENYEAYIEQQYEKDRLAYEKRSKEELEKYRQEQMAKKAALITKSESNSFTVRRISRCDIRAPKRISAITPINYISSYPANSELTDRKFYYTVPEGNTYEKKTVKFFIFQEGCEPAECKVTLHHEGKTRDFPTFNFTSKGVSLTMNKLTAGKELEIEVNTDIPSVIKLGVYYYSYQ